jgi:hypothetical protein
MIISVFKRAVRLPLYRGGSRLEDCLPAGFRQEAVLPMLHQCSTPLRFEGPAPIPKLDRGSHRAMSGWQIEIKASSKRGPDVRMHFSKLHYGSFCRVTRGAGKISAWFCLRRERHRNEIQGIFSQTPNLY